MAGPAPGRIAHHAGTVLTRDCLDPKSGSGQLTESRSSHGMPAKRPEQEQRVQELLEPGFVYSKPALRILPAATAVFSAMPHSSPNLRAAMPLCAGENGVSCAWGPSHLCMGSIPPVHAAARPRGHTVDLMRPSLFAPSLPTRSPGRALGRAWTRSPSLPSQHGRQVRESCREEPRGDPRCTRLSSSPPGARGEENTPPFSLLCSGGQAKRPLVERE